MTVDLIDSRQRITDFLAKQATGVLATADQSGKPHAATVYFCCDQQLNFYFVTKKETQKYRNLQVNSQAAIAVYDVPSQTTVQAMGNVTEVTEPSKMEWVSHTIWRLALQTSTGGAPPPMTKLLAGGYIIYCLSAPSLRMVAFNHPTNVAPDQQHLFDIVHTQPSL